MVQVTENGGGTTSWTARVRSRIRRNGNSNGGDIEGEIRSLEAMLATLRQEREDAQRQLASLGATRHTRILADADDNEVFSLDTEERRLRLQLERIAMLEPDLSNQLTQLRARQFSQRQAEYRARGQELFAEIIAAGEEAFAGLDRYNRLWDEATGYGVELPHSTAFISQESLNYLRQAVAVPPPPAPAARREPLANWNRIPAIISPLAVRGPPERNAVGELVVAHGAARFTDEPGPRPPVRELRCDGPPAAGERRVVMLRGGAELRPGLVALAGDRINLPSAQAVALVENLAAEFVTEEAV
jgi:hypothetical protein